MNILFFLVVTLAFTILHVTVGRGLISTSSLSKRAKRKLWALFASAFAIELFGTILFRFHAQSQAPLWLTIFMWVVYLLMGFFVTAFFLVLIRTIVRLMLKIVSMARKKEEKIFRHKPDFSRRLFLGNSASLGLGTLAFGLTGVGLYSAIKDPAVQRIKIPIPNLPQAFEGFRLLQISDMHIGPTLKRSFTKRVVALANQAKPDIIAMTGDMIDGTPEALRFDLDPLKGLNAPFGKFWVTGNHEYYWNAERWMTEAETLGFTVLHNDNRLIEKHGEHILIAGIPDSEGDRFYRHHRPDTKKAANSKIRPSMRILLAHQPRACFQASKDGFDLLLSGHTHGGQFIFWKYFVYLQQPFLEGLNEYDGMLVYVNKGTGYWGPPQRLGVASEITLIELTAKG